MGELGPCTGWESKAGTVDLSHTDENLQAKVKMFKFHEDYNRLSLKVFGVNKLCNWNSILPWLPWPQSVREKL